MTDQTAFSPEEWNSLLIPIRSVVPVVMIAAPGGYLRETFALAQGLAEADRRPTASELIHALFHGLISPTQTDVPAEKPTLEGSNLQDYQNMLLNNLLQAIRKAIILLQERALPQEVEEYRA